ncbi:MAG: ribonuclease HII [Halobacteriota archaeon]|jgi:ribonuclease HII
MKLAGVDEAGKGAVLGSLFVAGVSIDSSALKYLERMGLKDSKVLSPKRREFLSKRIKKVCAVQLQEITAQQIDELRAILTMNDILVRGHAQSLRRLKPDVAFVDAADVDASRFSRRVTEESGINEVIAEHKADSNHAIVSAASIIAKVSRDTSIQTLQSSLGVDIGSGYPSDARTITFLKMWLDERGDFPPGTRRSWKTAQDLLAATLQKGQSDTK